MKRANFTFSFTPLKAVLLCIAMTLTFFKAQAQTPGVCKILQQRGITGSRVIGNFSVPLGAILNDGTVLESGGTILGAGSELVLALPGQPATPDLPNNNFGEVPPGQTIYKVAVRVGISHPRAYDLDLVLGYTPPGGVHPANTRWITLTSDNGGNFEYGTNIAPVWFDDDADQFTDVSYPTAFNNQNLTVSRDYLGNRPARMAPEEPLGQLVGLLATDAAGQGGSFRIAVRDDTRSITPATATAAPLFEGTLGAIDIEITTIPTSDYGGNKYSDMTNQRNTDASGNTTFTPPPFGVRTRNVFTSGIQVDSILDNATISKSLAVTGLTGRVITDVDARIAFRHTFMGDLAMSLKSPSNTTITLMNRRGGNGDFTNSPAYYATAAPAQPAIFKIPTDQLLPSSHVAFGSLIFSDESDSILVNTTNFNGQTLAQAQTAIGAFGSLGTQNTTNALLVTGNDNVITDHDYRTNPSYPFYSASATNPRGVFQFTPEEGLAAFVGEDPNGAWTLTIADNKDRDVGLFDRFELAITSIPKPCIMDVAVSGGVGCEQNVGTASATICSNQFPLTADFIPVDTVARGNRIPDTQVGTTIVSSGGTFIAGSTAGGAASTNPRVIYGLIKRSLDVGGYPVPNPVAARITERYNDLRFFNPTFSPPNVVYPNAYPRHGFRVYPTVENTLKPWCRFPAVAASVANPVPTDSLALSVSDEAPVVNCKSDITVSLDTVEASHPGYAIINPFDIEDPLNKAFDDCTPRGGLQYVTLASKIGGDCSITGAYDFTFDPLSALLAFSGASRACPTIGANTARPVEDAAAILNMLIKHRNLNKGLFIRLRREATKTVNIGAIAPATMSVETELYNINNPNVKIVRTFTNAAAVAANTLVGTSYNVNLLPTGIIPDSFAIGKVISIKTPVNVTAGKISDLNIDLGSVATDSLRFTTMPRTVTCADIGAPRNIMLVVKDAGNKVDSCITRVHVIEKVKPTLACTALPFVGDSLVVNLPLVTDCSHALTDKQIFDLSPVAQDVCLPQGLMESKPQAQISIAPAYTFMLENTTDRPMIIEDFKIPVTGARDMLVKAFFMNVTNSAYLDIVTSGTSAQYPIVNKDVALAQSLLNPNNPTWHFWGQSIMTPQGLGQITYEDFIPRNFSNWTLMPPNQTKAGANSPYVSMGDNPPFVANDQNNAAASSRGSSLIIAPNGGRVIVYLTAAGLEVPTNSTNYGLVHQNFRIGSMSPSAPYPLAVRATPNSGTGGGNPHPTDPPLIIRGGWSTDPPATATNEFEQPAFPTVANPAPPAFPVTSFEFQSVVNFPLGYGPLISTAPAATLGGSPRMFMGEINYVYGESKLATHITPTPWKRYTLPSQGPVGSVRYVERIPVNAARIDATTDFTPAHSTLAPYKSFYTYEGIKQLSGIPYTQPYPIGRTVNVFQVTDKAGNTATCSQVIRVVPAPGAVPPQLVCNDKVNFSFTETCADTLLPSKFLASKVGGACLGALTVQILNGTNLLGTQSGAYTGVPLKTLVGGTYKYKITDVANTQNFCWGEVTFEDKLAPRLSCPDNLTIDDCATDLATSPTVVFTEVYGNPSAFLAEWNTSTNQTESTIPVRAPRGARVRSIEVQLDINIPLPATTTTPIGDLRIALVTPLGGQIVLASQPGTTVDANNNPIICRTAAQTIFKYVFRDNANNAPIILTNNYPCAPADGAYRPLDDLNNSLLGSLAEGDWTIQFTDLNVPLQTGANAMRANVDDFRLKLTMDVPVETAIVSEKCTDNLKPILAESAKTNSCTQDSNIVKVIKRTFSAKDAYGNIGSCSQTISYKRAKFREQVFPDDIQLDCSYNNLKANPSDAEAIEAVRAIVPSLAANYVGPWFDNNGNPHPNVSGKPRPTSCTSYNVNYTDMRIDDICSSGNGAFAVRRTWKAYDACQNRAIEFEQYIAVTDNSAPALTVPANFTVSPAVGACDATVTVPRPVVSDNCAVAADLNVVYELYSDRALTVPVGIQSSTQPNVFTNVPHSATSRVNGVLVADDYFIKFTVTDQCGNTSTGTSRFKVMDLVPPVAQCAPLIKVSLTQDGSALVNALDLDRGSYDNCGRIVKYEAWRVDDSDCVLEDANKDGDFNDEIDLDNDGFAEYPEFEYYKHPQSKIRFCCEDIGDTVMVMFRVWDNSPIIGRPNFNIMNPNYDYGVGTNGNVNVCMARIYVEDKLAPAIFTENTSTICGNGADAKAWLDSHQPQPKDLRSGANNLFFNTTGASIIPDSATTIVVPVSGIDTVADINVSLKFHHENLGNLIATITAPNGATAELFIQPTSENGVPYVSTDINGVPATNIFRLTFDDEPSLNPTLLPQFSSIVGVGDTITRGNLAAINGKYVPLAPLSSFRGINANGDWKVSIAVLDPFLADSGYVVPGGVQLFIKSPRRVSNQSYYFDNCEDVLLTYIDSTNINNCGSGFVRRNWTLSDAGGKSVNTLQEFSSVSKSNYTVLFPKDTTLTCVTGSTDTSYTGKPKVTTISGCPTVAVSYSDDIINASAGACYRIKRTWKVANLCQTGMMKGRTNTKTPDVALMSSTLPARLYKNSSDSTDAAIRPDFDTDGYVEYIQFINVNDKVAPTLTNVPSAIKLESVAKECKVKITIPVVDATDACSKIFTKSWEIINKATNAIVAKSDSTYPATASAYSFGAADFGKTFIVRYTVGDYCGNIARADLEVSPKDEVKPTALCYQGLSVDLNPTTRDAWLNVNQFDAGSSDNCAGAISMFIEKGTPTFGSTVPTTTMIGVDCKGFVPIRLWVTDLAGNTDYCDTYVDVQNNMGAQNIDNCTPVSTTGSKLLVTLNTLKGATITNAEVRVDMPFSTMMAKATTEGYTADVPGAQLPVKVSIEKKDNPLNGVSTFDLVLMSKHILATQPITKPLLLVAADVNNNGKVATSDVVELRRMILAIQTGFNNNKSWRFFADGDKSKEVLTLTNILKGQAYNFTGVKIGDINESANAASAPRTTGTMTFDVNEKSFVVGEEVKATFNADAIATMEGYQFTLGYDKEALELANIEGNNENFGVVENGVITTSWNGNAENSKNLFTVVFKAKKSGNLSEMLNVNSSFTSAEAYTKAGEYHNVALKFNGAKDRFALYQNQPNPFMGRTIIGFNLPKAEHAKMTVYDITGRILKVVEGNFTKGYNEVTIDEVLSAGVLNYKLETATETATKSMIIME